MSLYKQPTSAHYWCRFKYQGREYRKSTGETDRRKAEAFERAYRSQAETGALAAEPRLTSHVLAECFPLDEARAIAKGTAETSRVQLAFHWKTLLRHLGLERPLKEITYNVMTGYVASRRGEGASGQTIQKELYALKRGLELAQVNSWLPTVLVRLPQIKKSPPDKKRAGKLHPPEVLAAFHAELAPDVRDTYVFALLTGMRLHEIKRIRASWLRLTPEGAAPAFLEAPADQTKTREARAVALPQAAYAIVVRRLEGAEGDPLVFSQESHVVGVRAATKRALAKLGPSYAAYDKNITARDMRAMWATMTDRLWGDRGVVQAGLGHTNMAMTDKYVKNGAHPDLAAASNLTADWYLQNVGGIPPAHTDPKQGISESDAESKKLNDSSDLGVVSAVGIEPTTYGLRVCFLDTDSVPDMSNYAQLVAPGDTSPHVAARRGWQSRGAEGPGPGGAQNADVPWADDLDVELVG